MTETPLVAELQQVCHVDRRHDLLVWTTPKHGQVGQIELDKVLFILDLSKSEGATIPHFVVCCLKEKTDESAAHAFQLLLLSTDAVPHALQAEYQLKQMPTHLCGPVDAVVSTKSGLGQALAFWETVLLPLWKLVGEAFGTRGQPDKVFVTQNANSVRQFARHAHLDADQEQQHTATSRTILLLSGDGGVVDLLNGREQDDTRPVPTVALIPLGTGNALFHSLHKPVVSNSGSSYLLVALRTLFFGIAAPLPVFKASFSPGSRIVTSAEQLGKTDDEARTIREHAAVSSLYGAIVASYGFHASVVYESDTPEYRVHGDKRFGMVAADLLRQSHPYRAKLLIQRQGSLELEREPDETHGYVLVTMVSNLERTFNISPASKPLDGQLRLIRFGRLGGDRTMDVMMKAYDGGKHVGMKWDDGKSVEYEGVQEVVVEALDDEARWRKFCIDGTIVDVPVCGSMTVAKVQGPEMLRVLVDGRVLEAPSAAE
ncbi:hypothetical protein CDD82_5820 [Ophiocordyceps australis]|uniref:DAGKc domain-containing protein n=1 Tax=Ophiocordyceps australis TaxID=1399860 RepID=A0A2C5ZSS2_9HYPO|nr:hypothetical protein CDD82_5820 [Ophiocordyceps australis]